MTCGGQWGSPSRPVPVTVGGTRIVSGDRMIMYAGTVYGKNLTLLLYNGHTMGDLLLTEEE